MTTTYQDLIEDHERIEEAAGQLLSAIRLPETDHAEVSYRLLGLSSLVSEHLAIEAAMLNEISGRKPPPPWQRTLEEGLPSLEALKVDWLQFLGEWNAEAIEGDLAQFQNDAEAILPRLRERVQRETEALYTTALQTGVVVLR